MEYYIHDANGYGIGDKVIKGEDHDDALNNYLQIVYDEGNNISMSFKISSKEKNYDFTVGGQGIRKKRYEIDKSIPMVRFNK